MPFFLEKEAEKSVAWACRRTSATVSSSGIVGWVDFWVEGEIRIGIRLTGVNKILIDNIFSRSRKRKERRACDIFFPNWHGLRAS